MLEFVEKKRIIPDRQSPFLVVKPCRKTNPYLWVFSSDTLNLVLPLALRAANTFWPFFVDIRNLNPCLFLRRLVDG